MMIPSMLLSFILLPRPLAGVADRALGPADMTALEMNFDRHWATGVALADSIVVRSIQDVWSLPGTADSVLEASLSACRFEALPGGIDSILALMETLDRDCSVLIESLPCSDSLALFCGGMWAMGDSAGTPGEPGLIWTSRGITPPLDEADIELELDEFTDLLGRWPGIDIPSPGLVVGLVLGIQRKEDPGTGTAPGVMGTVHGYSLDGPVTWVIGDCLRNVYTGQVRYDLIVDHGGDDLYLCGGDGVGVTGDPVGIIADLAGSDTYISDSPVSQGSGFMGYGALVDLEGSDSYQGSSMAQGSALMGGGLLADLAGNDLYDGDVHSQAAATLGSAFLFDLNGDDTRRVTAYGQGFGGPAGKGTFVDGGGHDVYLAGFEYPHEPLLPRDNIAMSQGFGTGLRPFCAGGIGVLCDLGTGSDTYRAEVFGQGGAYFYSLGILMDTGGQDTYSSAQYSQGSGIHLASGILVDCGGDDQYTSRRGPSQGAAHDLSTGFLLDMEGEDTYATDGGQGLALTNSAAVFCDMAGSDLYALRGSGLGEALPARGSTGSALFMDLADRDFYSGAGSDSTSWTMDWSAGTDLPGVSPVTAVEQEEPGDPSELEIDSLFSVASEWGVSGNRERVLAHRAELADRGDAAVDHILAEHLDSWDGLEHRAITAVFQENPEYAAAEMLSLLQDSLGREERANIIDWLGDTGKQEAVPVLEGMLTDSLSPGLTVLLIRTLGEIGNPGSLQVIVPFTGSASERIRRQTAVTLGEFGTDAVEYLECLSHDPSLAVRSAASFSLEATGDDDID